MPSVMEQHQENIERLKQVEEWRKRESRHLAVLVIHGSGRHPTESCSREMSNSQLLLERGLELARLAGELWAVSDVVDLMEMPVLSAFLEDRSEQLQEIAMDEILQAAGERALSHLMAATGAEIRELGANEVAEGVVRGVAAAAMADRAEELAEAGAVLAEEGLEELAVADAAGDVAQDLAAEGVADVAEGAADLGRAAAMDEVADEMKRQAK